MAGTINKPKKPKSKRTPVRLRHKIEKASAAKQRKARKLAKKNPEWRSKLKKDPGIPNLFPYKERLLQEIEEKKLQKQQEARRKRELAKAAATTSETPAHATRGGVDDDGDDVGDEILDGDDDMMEVTTDDESNPMAALLASARAAAEQYERELQSGDEMEDVEDDDDDDDDEEEEDRDLHDADRNERKGNEISVGQSTSRKAYDKIFKEVVDQADVVLYVLDARDPEGTRSREVERAVMAASGSGKRLILVLNKIDLVPALVLKEWLVYLRRSFPTIPLRASNPAPNAHTFNHKGLTVQNTATTLFRALKAFAAARQLKRAVSVGVIGYPNVGKSSVINALLSRLSGKGPATSKACPAGAEAGVTTSIRAVKIDSKLTLLDSPGVVFPSTSSVSSGGLVSLRSAADAHAHLVLLNAVPPKQIDDPLPAVTLLLRRLGASVDLLQKLYDVYDIAAPMPSRDGDGNLTTDFLVQVARKRGRLGRGGVPNIDAAAMTVITDWRDGRIQGWAEAPTVAAANLGDDMAPTVDQKLIVTEWAKEFKIEGLWGIDELEDTEESKIEDVAMNSEMR